MPSKDQTVPRRRQRRRSPPSPTSKFMERPELLAEVPLSQTAIDELERRGDFPKRVQLAPLRRCAWVRAEVNQWLRERIAARDTAARKEQQHTAT